MATIDITSSGTYLIGNKDRAEIDIPGGGTVTLQAQGSNVGKIQIDYMNNDSVTDVVTVDLSTFAQDDLQIDVFHYDPSDEINLAGATITGVDPDDESRMLFTYVGSDGQTYSGFVNLKDGGEQDFTDPDQPIVICLTRGTRILTDRGEVAVEDLSVGDLVMTRDNGLQCLRWIGRRMLDRADLARFDKLFPVRIKKGALGPQIPGRDLLVSPQHRMLVSSRIAERMFDIRDVLVPAVKLVGLPGILIDKDVPHVEYFHLLFDRHEVIFAEGAPTESLFVGPVALKSLSQDSLAEILTLFPELAERDNVPKPALPIPPGRLQKRLVERHFKNRKPLLESFEI